MGKNILVTVHKLSGSLRLSLRFSAVKGFQNLDVWRREYCGTIVGQ
jgi:hypothetical protein